jgi:hypothetical protein
MNVIPTPPGAHLRVITDKGIYRVSPSWAGIPTFINVPAGVCKPGHPDFVDLAVRCEPHVQGEVLSIEYRRE